MIVWLTSLSNNYTAIVLFWLCIAEALENVKKDTKAKVKSNSRNIIYVGRFGLPDTAPGLRVFNVAKALSAIGYSTKFVSTMSTKYEQKEFVNFDSFDYIFVNICNFKNKIVRTMINLFELLTAHKSFRYLIRICKKEKPYAIFLYNDLYPLTKNLITICRIHNILLLADVTEWYEKRKYRKLGDWIIPYWTDKRIRKLDSKLDGIIAISSYLQNYYHSIGCQNVICVPPLIDNIEGQLIDCHKSNDNRIVNIVYAGSPGSKDILTPVFDAIDVINKTNINIRFDVIGIDEQQIQTMWKETSLDVKGIYAHGKLPHDKTLEIIKNSDFSILLRENKRYAKAGYSTKFAECLSNGVGMICNKVDGTDIDLEDNYNGFFVDSTEKDDIIKLFLKILSLTNEDICSIKRNSNFFAKNKYNILAYKAQFQKLLDKKED